MKRLLLALIRAYRRFISPVFPSCCRYYPTCSQYAMQAIAEHGALRGLWLAVRRLCRCHPFSRHDYFDPVPRRHEHDGAAHPVLEDD